MPPLRVERFNDNGRHPNKLISFIKEDKRSSEADQKRALGILNRVAAIVYPVMKENGLQVTTLEEHPFNDSYAGINYNAGECIGLVLRTRRNAWVPEAFVLSVMLHELSHITNMHHAGPFWKTLGQYRVRMSALQASGYTGEGFWSRGQQLGGSDTVEEIKAEELPRHVCGGAGTARRTRRRRATGRAAKRAKTGVKLGGDLEVRKKLDGGKSKATPRVVKSKRGQELRASAAELRFSAQLTEQFKDEEDEYEYDEEKYKLEDEDQDTQNKLKDEMKDLKQSLIPFKPIKKEVLELSDTEDELPGNGRIDDEQIIGPACPICTLHNAPGEPQCSGCGNLMQGRETGWSCAQCPSEYRNPGSLPTCSLCGSRKETINTGVT